MKVNRGKESTCKYCGAKMPPDLVFCKSCGRKREIFHPNFEVDNEGNVICNTYSQNNFFKNHAILYAFAWVKNWRKSCLTCVHYKKDNCYFSKTALKAISRDLGWNIIFSPSKFKCDICRRKIFYMSNVLYKFYMKEFKNVDIIQLCCICNYTLKKGKPYDIFFRIKQPLLFLIYMEIIIFMGSNLIIHSFNFLVLLFFLLIPLISGLIYFCIRLKRGYARKSYINRLSD